MDDQFLIEIIYPLPQEQVLLTIPVYIGTTVKQAIEQSGILKKYSEINLDDTNTTINKVGIFSKLTKLTEPLREGDRIEIYRSLIADPKEARKKKATIQKNSKYK